MKLILICFIFILITSLSLCQETGVLIDERDGKSYKTVCLNGVVWMAENLAFKPENGNCWAYDNDCENVKGYGLLYDWKTSYEVCPPGWRLPNNEEFNQLIELNSNGFNFVKGGYRYSSGEYFYLGVEGFWWSSTIYDDEGSIVLYYGLIFGGNEELSVSHGFGPRNAHSVRCVKEQK